MNQFSKQYLSYTFLIMILCWGICVLFSICGIYLTDHYFLYIPYLLGGWSPTIASYIVLGKNGKLNSFKEWLKTVFDFKHNTYSYFMLLALAMVFLLPQCLISGYENGAPLFALVLMIPLMLFGGGLEETGWRCILQPELEKRYGYTVSTLVVSLIWWFWHLPLFFIRGVSQYGTDFLAFGINILGLSFALGAIKNTTNSVWLCVLFHCLINSLQGVYIVGENIAGNVAGSIALILVSYGLIHIQKRKQVFQ